MRYLALFIFAFLLPCLAFAGPLDEGSAAYNTKDYKTALQLLKPLADKGDPKAQWLVGNIYAYGLGVHRDEVEGSKWCQKAADSGYAAAERDVGEAYRVLKGSVKVSKCHHVGHRDDAEAMKWLRRAAKHGSIEAEFEVGLLYDFGNPGVPKDKAEAVRWWQKSAEHGFDIAQYQMGEYYSSLYQYNEAAKWYLLAAQQGEFQAQRRMGDLYAQGRGVIQDFVQAYMWYSLTPVGRDGIAKITYDMTPEQIIEAKRLAAEWKLLPIKR